MKCFGCGARFHERDPNEAGFLPHLQDRIEARALGIPFAKFKQEKDHTGSRTGTLHSNLDEDSNSSSFSRYLQKKKFENYASSTLFGELTTITEAENIEAFKADVKGEKKITDIKEDLHNGDECTRLVCSRCHRLQHHQATNDETKDERNKRRALEVYRKVEENLQKNLGGFTLAICDILDFPASLNPEFIKGLGSTRPVVVLVNKMDLIPDKVNLQSLKSALSKYLKNNLNLKNVVECHLVSLKHEKGLDEVIKSIFKLKGSLDDIYILGTANVGKSTFMNCLLKKLDGPKDIRSTESWIPGTTIETIPIPIASLPKLKEFTRSSKALSGNLIDMPGLPIPQITSHLTSNELRYAVPTKKIQPYSYMLNPGRSMWIGGMVRIDYVEGSAKVIATTVLSPLCPVHTSSILKAEWLWTTHGGGISKDWSESILLPKPEQESLKVVRKNENKDLYAGIKFVPPFLSTPEEYVRSFIENRENSKEQEASGISRERMKMYPRFKLALTHEFTREKSLATSSHAQSHFKSSIGDIVLSGIGWVSIAGNFSNEDGRKAVFKVYSPNGEGVYLRFPSLIPELPGFRGKKIEGHPDGKYRQKEKV